MKKPEPTEVPVRLDLRCDFADIYTHLVDRIRRFDPTGSDVLGGPGPVKMVEVGFEYSQSGWLVVAFDARPDAQPDGEWTHLITEENMLERPHWLEAGETWPLTTVIQLNGKEGELPLGTDLAEVLGEMVKAVVLKARADGVFAGLPKTRDCELGVEHFDGAYGWPLYEDRGQENFAEPTAAERGQK